MRSLFVLVTALMLSQAATAQEKLSLGETKSLSLTEQSSDSLWAPDEIQQKSSEEGQLKDLMSDTPPSIAEKRLTVPQGILVFSQLWDITCADICHTKLVLEKPDGTKKVLLDDYVPHILPPEDSKALTIDDQVSISDDLKTLWIDTDKGVQAFDLNS